jgi:membrane protein required for colicin V production
MTWFLDGAAILFILFLGYIGFNRGLIEELGRLIGLIIAILISMSNTKSISDKIVGIVGLDDWIIKILTFTLLFIVTIVLTRLLTKMLNIAILSKNNQMMNQSLGFTFGAFKGFFIIMTILWFIALLPKQKWTSFMGKKSNILIISNQFRISIISFFNWDDPVELSESYIKQLTQP